MTLARMHQAPNRTAAMQLPELIHAGSVLTGEGKIGEACALYSAWIEGNATHPLLHAAHFNLSTFQTASGDIQGAVQSLAAAITFNGDFLPAYINLGRIHENLGAPDKALELWYAGVNRPMQINGLNVQHITTALKQIARLQMEREQNDLAEQALARSISIDPSQEEVLEQYLALRMRELRWPVLAPLDNLDSKAMLRRFHPLSVAAFTDDPLLQLASAYGYSRRLLSEIGDTPPETDRRDVRIDLTGRRIRVGYLSSDLRDHAIGYLLTDFFELQDKDALETFTYFIGKAPPSAISTRIQAAVDHWCDARELSDAALAEQIVADGIDILIDVNGHTRDARMGVLARQPAPIIVNWLGFPGTMGTPFHQYIVADPFIIPPDSEKYYSEKVLRLPCYQANDRKRAIAATPTRTETGLPDDKFVFCSFNAMHKITRFTLDRWSEILRSVPDSVFWMLDCSAQAKQALAVRFERLGVSASRLYYAPKIANAHHLARYPLADLFLDALPYGAHTTASDALWMGVPVLTLSGRCFASRVCGSLVRAAGLDELVVTDSASYVQKAIALAQAPAEMTALRQKLAANRDTCVLFDQPGLARSMRDLYQFMVAEHQAGRTFKPDLANLDAYLEAGLAFDHEGEELSGAADYEARYQARLVQLDRREPLRIDTRFWRG